jgi:hypothetical protein
VNPAGAADRRTGGLLPGLLLNAALPLAVYALLRPHVDGEVTALAVAGGIPVVITLARLVRDRRLDPIGALAVAGFGAALLVSWLSGGDTLVLKLQDSVVTGPLGLACLASVAVRRPLSLVLLRRLARGNPRLRARVTHPGHQRAATVLTALLGTTMLLHAVARLVLALSVPTGTFLALGWSIIGAGGAAMLWYRRRLSGVRPDQVPAPLVGNGR